jgi:hypothetical protein
MNITHLFKKICFIRRRLGGARAALRASARDDARRTSPGRSTMSTYPILLKKDKKVHHDKALSDPRQSNVIKKAVREQCTARASRVQK